MPFLVLSQMYEGRPSPGNVALEIPKLLIPSLELDTS